MRKGNLATAPSCLASFNKVLSREVWANNFDDEFARMLRAATTSDEGSVSAPKESVGCKGDMGGGNIHCNQSSSSVIAFDTEFPGFARHMPQHASREAQYKSLRNSVNVLRPIQFGVAIAVNGSLRGVWNFNMRFDLAVDLHTEEAVAFLSSAGIDFTRHATDGVDPALFGQKLASSPLVCHPSDATNNAGTRYSDFGPPEWVTFAGMFDLGYLLKLLTNDLLPRDADSFYAVLGKFCPKRCELQDFVPFVSLQSSLEMLSVKRHGVAHTAGSDALATLELFSRVVPGVTAIQVDGWSYDDPNSTIYSEARSPNHATFTLVGSQQSTSGAGSGWQNATGAATEIAVVDALASVSTFGAMIEGEKAAPAALWGKSARACMVAANDKAEFAAWGRDEGVGVGASQPFASKDGRVKMRRMAGKPRVRTTSFPLHKHAANAEARIATARQSMRAVSGFGAAVSTCCVDWMDGGCCGHVTEKGGENRDLRLLKC
eukprot:TRINITY_DN355_c0_g1_i2.p1 TRINITY_DN355_c0_g1~~TRINITY_DN355_c0_g1_i2.p1  ORF type:complete len:489 (+),score=72.31 TRINITY_DN355_c0_g1_i2:137-1603(+)